MVKSKLIAFLTTSQIILACVSSGHGPAHRSVENLHVHQTNGKDILTELTRDHWLQVRKSSKSQHQKLYSSLGTREWNVAISDARAYLAKNPRDIVALQVLSLALSMKQNFSLAAYYIRLLEKYHPGQVETLNIQGLAILNQPGATFADFRKAMNKFEEAFENSPREIASGLNLGHLHLEMGNAAAAQDVFKIVQDRCDNCTAALLGFGVASSRVRDFDEARDAFERIIDKEPNHLRAKYYIAVVENYGFSRKKKAVSLLAEVLEDTSSKQLEIKRQANFLMRRVQAQIYAEKKSQAVALEIENEAKDMEIALERDEDTDSKRSIIPANDD